MYSIKMKLHMDMSKLDLDEVIIIKSKQWPYSYHEQLEWMTKNLKDTDIHVVLIKDEKNVGYLNLIDINIIVNNNLTKAFGIGNVCAVSRGQGFGYELMKLVNKYIIQSKNIGLLFCKEPLLKFYHKLDWSRLENKNFKVVDKGLEAMIFNRQFSLSENFYIEYDGVIF